MSPEPVTTADVSAAVDVLTDAFAGYPVMRYVLDGPAAVDDPRLRTLVRFFVLARLWRGHPVLGIRDDDRLVAVATITPPDPGPGSPRLDALREEVWAELGDGARSRYRAFGSACDAFDIDPPHHHLNMIGVTRSHHGRGLASPLMDAVHALADQGPGSAGVTLTTETEANPSLYDHFGYERIGHERVADGLETWGFFRASTDA